MPTMYALAIAIAAAAPPEPDQVWTSESHRVYAHCLAEDGRWAAMQVDGLHRGPNLESIEGNFGTAAMVVGDCELIVHTNDRSTQLHLLDPFTGDERLVQTGVQFVQMAVSPDQSTLVIGGWDAGDAIAIVDLASAQVRRLDGPTSHVDWRFSPDGTLFWYAKTWKQKSHVIRDIASLDKVKEESISGTVFAPAAHPSAHDAWDHEWSLTDEITVKASELGALTVSGQGKRTGRLVMAVHGFKILDDDTLLLFRRQTTRSNGISASVFAIEGARPKMLRWFLEDAK